MLRNRKLLFLKNLVSWTYLLQDMFSDDRSVGAVNGTLATDGINVRSVSESPASLNISSGYIAGTGAGNANPALYYPTLTRSPGIVMLFKGVPVLSNSSSQFCGLSSLPTTLATESFISVNYGSGFLTVTGRIGGNNTPIAIPNLGEYQYGIVLRSAGAFYFINTGSNFLLIGIDSLANTATLYPVAHYRVNNDFKFDHIKVVKTWMPTPLISHGFGTSFGASDGLGHAEGIAGGIGSGGSGVALSGATWSISAGKAVNTPTLGVEQVSDPGLEGTYTGGLCAVFTAKNGSPTLAQSSDVHGGSKAQEFTGNASGDYINFSPSDTIGDWKRVELWAKRSVGTANNVSLAKSDGVSALTIGVINQATYTKYAMIYRAKVTASNYIRVITNFSGVSDTVIVDDISLKTITFSTLLSLSGASTSNIYSGVDLTVVSGFQAGLALNWDSTSSPANGVIAYRDGVNCKLEKCVAGVWTTVISAAATYSANARIVVSKIGTAYRLYYNNAHVGNGTISDAGIVNNTLHGLFSTDVGNTLDNYTCYASGVDDEYAILKTV